MDVLYSFFQGFLMKSGIFVFCMLWVAQLTAQIEDKVRSRIPLMIRDSALFSQVSVSDSGLAVYAPGQTTPEFFTPWKDAAQWGTVLQSASLEDAMAYYLSQGKAAVHILMNRYDLVLDPGHFADNELVAEYERKYMRIKDTNGLILRVFESDLNFRVARQLADSLLLQGFSVKLTRNRNETVFGCTYNTWYDSLRMEHLNLALERNEITEAKFDKLKVQNRKDLCRSFFTGWELRARGDSIRVWRPLLTISLHLNVNETNKLNKEGNFEATDSNYSMVFLPGAFCKGELDAAVDRMLFVARLLDPADWESTELAGTFLEELEGKTGVKPVERENNLSYLNTFSVIAPKPGVYHRNLALLERVPGQVLLTEPLLQDHLPMLRRLSQDAEAPLIHALVSVYLKTIHKYSNYID